MLSFYPDGERGMMPNSFSRTNPIRRYPMNLLEVQSLSKAYGQGETAVHALKNVSFSVPKGEYVAVVGESGSGKSTLLNMVGALDTPTSGKVLIDGKDTFSMKEKQLTVFRRRNIGFIFQSFNLIPELTVEQNIIFPVLLDYRKPDKRYLEELLTVLNLKERRRHLPSQLSGGQQQRVAIARTLAPEPSVLFMDEPLSNLDAKLRLEMRYELQRLHVETGSTFVYVTHDQMEAMTLATQICLINNGVLQQYDAPLTVYNRPNNLFVADFVGNPSINFVEAKGAQRPDGGVELTIFDDKKAVFYPAQPMDLPAWFQARDDGEAALAEERKRQAAEKSYVEKGNKDEVFRYHIAKVEEEDDSLMEEPVLTNEDLVLGIRPEFLDIADDGALAGEIYGAMPTGMESTIKVRIGEYLLTGVVFGSALFTIGARVRLDIGGMNIMLFDRKSGRHIASGRLEC